MPYQGRPPPGAPATTAGGRIAAIGRRLVRGAWQGGQRIRRLQTFATIGVQAGLAAALAWTLASQVLRNPDPVFAPAVAVSVIATSIGQHIRRTLQLIGGVIIGIAIGDLVLGVVGTGPWQVGAVVTIAVVLALALDGSSTLMSQSGGTAVLVVALHPVSPDLEVPRFINAALGGAVGLAVYLLLFPLNPLRLIDRRSRPVIEVFAAELAAVAEALSARDLDAVESSLRRLRDEDAGLVRANRAVSTAMEIVTLAPARRHSRPVLVAYSSGFEFLDRALRNSRGTVRRLADLIRDGERVPATLPRAVSDLGSAATMLYEELLAGRPTRSAEASAVQAAVQAQRGLADGAGPNGVIAIAQILTGVFDLIRASGADRAAAREVIREARRRAAQPQ